MDKRRIAFGLGVTVIALGLLAAPVFGKDATKKFTRGAINTTTGWTELPLQVVNQSSEDLFRGTTYGFMDGLSLGLKRTLYGAWDWVTFPIPPYDNPVMEPETVFGEAP